MSINKYVHYVYWEGQLIWTYVLKEINLPR